MLNLAGDLPRGDPQRFSYQPLAMYPRTTVVTFHPFSRRQDGEEVIIGRPETGIFLAIPSDAAEVLDSLAEGKSIGEAAEIYRQKQGEIPDMDDLLSLLESHGIIRRTAQGAAGSAADLAISQSPPKMKYHFSNFPSAWAQRIFSRPVITGCGLIIVLAVIATVRHPALLVGPRDLYFTDHRTLSWALLAIATYAAVFAHELAHLVAARALEINSRISIGHRLWYLVAETDLTGLWSVPKQKRYLPLVAGMLLDAVSAAGLVLLLLANQGKWVILPIMGTRLLRAMLFTYLARIAWQGFLFVRTDFYYVLANFFNCKNLLGDTEAYLRNQLARPFPRVRKVDQSAIPQWESRVIRVYAWLWVAGRIAALSTLAVITTPLAIRYARDLASAFRTGYSANASGFVDTVVVASCFFIPLTLGFMLWIGGMFRGERT